MTDPQTELHLLAEISNKLDMLIGLTAIGAEDSKKEQVRRLYELGFDRETIGAIVGLSAGRVRGIKSESRSPKGNMWS